MSEELKPCKHLYDTGGHVAPVNVCIKCGYQHTRPLSKAAPAEVGVGGGSDLPPELKYSKSQSLRQLIYQWINLSKIIVENKYIEDLINALSERFNAVMGELKSTPSPLVALDEKEITNIIREYFGIVELTSEKFKDEYAALASDVVNYSMTTGLAKVIMDRLELE